MHLHCIEKLYYITFTNERRRICCDRYELCETYIDNMNWKTVVTHNDNIFERKKGECGIVMRFRGCVNTVVYLIKSSIFQNMDIILIMIMLMTLCNWVMENIIED